MNTERIKTVFDEFVRTNLSPSEETDAFVKYADGVATEMFPVVNSFNLKESDIEFGYFCAYFHKIGQFESLDTESLLFSEEGFLYKAFPEDYADYAPILREVINNCDSVSQPDIKSQRTGTFVHLLRDSVFLYRARIAHRELCENPPVIHDTLSNTVIDKINYLSPILDEDVVTDADRYADSLESFLSVVFVASKDIIEDNNYFADLCEKVEVTDKKTAERLNRLKSNVSKFLLSRENIVSYRFRDVVERFRIPLGIKIAGILILLITAAGIAFMVMSMSKVSKLPEWQAIKQTGKAGDFFGNPLKMIFGDEKSNIFSTDFDTKVERSLLGTYALCEAGKPISSMNGLIKKLQSDAGDLDAAILLMDLTMRYGYYDAAISYFNAFLAGKNADGDDVDRINAYLNRLDSIYATYEAVEEIMHNTTVGADSDDISAYRTAVAKSLDELLLKPDYDKETVYEYLLPLTDNLPDFEKIAQKITELNPYNVYPLFRLAIAYRSSGRQAEALATIEKAYKINSEDSDLLRAYSSIETVAGNKAKAVELARTAYNASPEGDYVAEAYLIALVENGQRADAETLYNQLKSTHEFEEDFLNYWSGTLSAYDYYVEKEDN